MRSIAQHRELSALFPLARLGWRGALEAAIDAAVGTDQGIAHRLIELLDEIDGDADFEPDSDREHVDEREPDCDGDASTPIAGGGSAELAYQAGDRHYSPNHRGYNPA